jgi:predicted deacylase
MKPTSIKRRINRTSLHAFLGEKSTTKPFVIGDISAEAGTKSTGFLKIQDDDAGIVRILVGIANGSEPGPVVCITGGMYGTIFTGIDACIRIHNDLDPKRLKGTVITVPVMEMTGSVWTIPPWTDSTQTKSSQAIQTEP